MTMTSPHKSIWTDLTRVPFTQGYLDAGGVRTRYLAAGDEDKPLLILIHGTGGHAEAYSRNLAAHAEHFRTYAIDLVGHGWSDKPKLDYEIADYAKHVINVIKALGHKKAALHMRQHGPEAPQGCGRNTRPKGRDVTLQIGAQEI